jgi:uncharacterized membrane protein
MEKMNCKICGKSFPVNELFKGIGVRHEVERLIQKDFPNWNDDDWICANDLKNYRMKYVSNLIEEEKGRIEDLDRDVLKSIDDSEMISSNIFKNFNETLRLPDRISDNVARFGGSWRFIIIFFVVLLVWIVINSSFLIRKPFDPYPFILMNLILSCIAALQAPIIMMSQNRVEAKDRLRSENDYKVNLKAEIEIRTLHEKVDHLLLEQWSKMMKIQEMQIEILEEIKKDIKKA